MPKLTERGRGKHQHQFVGVMTIEGYMWCQDCDKWIKIIKQNQLPPKNKRRE